MNDAEKQLKKFEILQNEKAEKAIAAEKAAAAKNIAEFERIAQAKGDYWVQQIYERTVSSEEE